MFQGIYKLIKKDSNFKEFINFHFVSKVVQARAVANEGLAFFSSYAFGCVLLIILVETRDFSSRK